MDESRTHVDLLETSYVRFYSITQLYFERAGGSQSVVLEALTVETQVSSVSAPVASNLTVNLTGPAGISFYSDPACTLPISSIVISNGTSASSFYFVAANVGSPSLSAAATSYTGASQSQTISSNPFIWMGGGGNANWDTAANWSGGSAAPGAGDIAVFSSSCSSNCSPTVNVPINIRGLRMGSGYTGTIDQGANSITIGGAGFSQRAGTFNGGSAAINVSGNFTLAGGTFRSTSGNLTYLNNFSVLGSPTFDHNLGTVTAYSPDWALSVMSPGSAAFYNVVMSTTPWGQNALDGTTMTVEGNLTLAGSGYDFNNGTFAVAGNVTAVSGGVYGSIRVKLTGRSTGQTITGTASDLFPAIEIATGFKPVTLSGTINTVGDFIITSIGTLTTTGSTLQLSCADWFDCFAEFNSKHINHLVVSPDGNGQQFFNNSGPIVDGNLTISSGGYGIHGPVSVYGNVAFTAPGSGGGMNLTFLGSSFTLSVAGSTAVPAGNVNVSKTAGQTLTLATDVAWASAGQNLNVGSGAINMAGHNLTVAGSVTLNSNTITKSGGALIVGGSTIGTGSVLGGNVNP